jgi:hypothetical protein
MCHIENCLNELLGAKNTQKLLDEAALTGDGVSVDTEYITRVAKDNDIIFTGEDDAHAVTHLVIAWFYKNT